LQRNGLRRLSQDLGEARIVSAGGPIN